MSENHESTPEQPHPNTPASNPPAPDQHAPAEGSLKPLIWIGVFFLIVIVLFVLGNPG